jgi:hypothetical protein
VVVVPQLPSVLTANDPVAAAVEEAVVELAVEVLPVALRYQLAFGSPRQSPTVTPLYPLAFMDASM